MVKHIKKGVHWIILITLPHWKSCLCFCGEAPTPINNKSDWKSETLRNPLKNERKQHTLLIWLTYSRSSGSGSDSSSSFSSSSSSSSSSWSCWVVEEEDDEACNFLSFLATSKSVALLYEWRCCRARWGREWWQRCWPNQSGRVWTQKEEEEEEDEEEEVGGASGATWSICKAIITTLTLMAVESWNLS